MDPIQSRAIGAVLLFVFLFLSGFWVSRSGKPYSAIRFNIHKFIGLATVAFLAVTLYQMHQAAPLGATEIVAAAATLLLFAVNIVAGGLVSIDEPMPVFVLMVHRVFPYLITLSAAATLYLVLGRAY